MGRTKLSLLLLLTLSLLALAPRVTGLVLSVLHPFGPLAPPSGSLMSLPCLTLSKLGKLLGLQQHQEPSRKKTLGKGYCLPQPHDCAIGLDPGHPLGKIRHPGSHLVPPPRLWVRPESGEFSEAGLNFLTPFSPFFPLL